MFQGASWTDWFNELSDPCVSMDIDEAVAEEDALPDDERVRNCVNTLPSTSESDPVSPVLVTLAESVNCYANNSLSLAQQECGDMSNERLFPGGFRYGDTPSFDSTPLMLKCPVCLCFLDVVYELSFVFVAAFSIGR